MKGLSDDSKRSHAHKLALAVKHYGSVRTREFFTLDFFEWQNRHCDMREPIRWNTAFDKNTEPER